MSEYFEDYSEPWEYDECDADEADYKKKHPFKWLWGKILNFFSRDEI